MRDSSRFADYLRDAMRAAGIEPDQRGAAAELARKAGLSETQVSRWLNKGHQPSIENLRKIAPVLHIRMADLLVHADYVEADEVSEAPTTAEQGITGDPSLSARERRMLLALLFEVRQETGHDPDAPGPAQVPHPASEGGPPQAATG